MSKIALAILTGAAFVYALWLVAAGRELPRPARLSGLRRRFALATLLFVGLISAVGCKSKATEQPEAMCYTPAMPPVSSVAPNASIGLNATCRAAWRALDRNETESLRTALTEAAERGEIRPKVADMLAVAHDELAFHKYKTEGDGALEGTCYSLSNIGSVIMFARDRALKQVELLEKARASGTIDKDTAAKAQATLARELEILYRTNRLEQRELKGRVRYEAEERLIKEYKAGSLEASDSAEVAAGLIAEMEGVRSAVPTVAERLAMMKKRVEALLAEGPPFNDWQDPDIRPNIGAILAEAGVRESKSTSILCYSRCASPIEARSEELKAFQRELLDKQVENGVLDPETAEKAAAATAQEAHNDYATEPDIRAYQRKVRRAARLLWAHGEVPSTFYERLIEATDGDIAQLDLSKALREDVGYCMRAVWLGGLMIHDDVMKVLEERKLIPPARNLSHVLDPVSPTEAPSPEATAKLAALVALLDGDGRFKLKGDSATKIQARDVPEEEKEYRLAVRKACRALVKTGFKDPEWIVQVEAILGVPIVGVIKAE